ncbi:MAG: 4Fe-4S binding protein [Myxococcota bacterium]|nr:4Fe-4S binding protein [Myxococcota bacterium]MDW8361145.1 4Fe-4S dicluster domain-containing protein [Myxococcales bacterium]
MGIHIDVHVCNGCGTAEEAMCVRDCPGDLIVLGPDRRARIRDNRACWDCAACVKVCPTQAITMQLPPEISLRGVRLRGRALRHKTVWRLRLRDGTERAYETPSTGRPPHDPNL